MRRLALAVLLAAGPATALDLAFLDRPPTAADETVANSVALPIGAWRDGAMPTLTAEGTVRRRAWRLSGSQLTTLQLLGQARAQVEAGGYEVVYACADVECGGFDFRFALPLLPEPDMHVDLGDFRHLTARAAGGSLIGVTVSRSQDARFVHVLEATPDGAAPAAAGPPPREGPPAGADTRPVPAAADPADLAARLDAEGRVVLDDLRFATGSAMLEGDAFASLAALADYLRAHPLARITLVGHSDAAGGQAPNLALSKARAEAVRRRLVERHAVAPQQVSADGVGYLAPLASNATEEGRALNRRVEAIRDDTN